MTFIRSKWADAAHSPVHLLAVCVTLALTAALTGCASLSSDLPAPPGDGSAPVTAQQQHAGTGLEKVHDPKKVTYSRTLTSCQFRDGGQLPDRACTPGAIDPAVTQQNIRSTICRSGYTTTVRPSESQTERAKFHVAYLAYHLRHSARSELDHLVSLELGGANDIANLWPEVGKLPNPKDKVENDLHRAVCAGKVLLAAAQQAIATDWTTAEARLGLGLRRYE
jgi:hypothetical protein